MGDENRLELAREAAVRAIEVLGPRDRVGVLAFDDKVEPVVDLEARTDKRQAATLVRGIRAGGGTVMYPALREAFAALGKTDAKRRHVILLTDGEAEEADFAGLVRQMAGAGITVSTVGIGGKSESPYQQQLNQLATLGRGKYYYAGSAATVPQIFARETERVNEEAVQDGYFPPTLRPPPLEPLKRIEANTLPDVRKYVLTRPKPTAEVGLAVGDRSDPLLAVWRPGLGVASVFTSGFGEGWPGGWDEGWPQFRQFWGQLTRYTARKDFPGLLLAVDRRGGRGVVTVDLADPNGRFIDKADLEVRVIDPNKLPLSTPTRQVGPGRYRAEFDAPPGRDPAHSIYDVTVIHKTPDGKPAQWRSSGLAVGYSEEARLRPPNMDLLRAVADETGGAFDPAPTDVFAPPARPAQYPVSLWPYLAAAAAVLFAVDVALRRVDLSGVISRARMTRNRVG